MLIRSKGVDAAGKAQPYWPTLWSYIDKNKERAARREQLQLMAREWKDRKGLYRLFGLAGWSSLLGFRGLAAPGSLEDRYLRWSQCRAVVVAIVMVPILALAVDIVNWAVVNGRSFEALPERWAYLLGKDLPLPERVKIEAGSFMMGSEGNAREQPVHRVTFAQAFYIGRTEVTFQEWDACVAGGGCLYRPDDLWDRGREPVVNVSWNDAQAYVGWLNQKTGKGWRLPSEAEWEYAARAVTITEYALPAPDGSNDIAKKELANCKDCRSSWDEKALQVASFPANEWGMRDMHGNVFEWVEDCWHDSYDGAPEDGRAWDEENGGDCSLRGLRGGSWDHDQDSARSADREWRGLPHARSSSVGFRVVCSSPVSGSER